MKIHPTDDVVRLTTAPNAADAHIWEQALKNAGIDCRVVGDFLDAGVGDIPGMLPEIWVHHADLARAQAVLEHRDKRPVEKPWEHRPQAE
jgi:hypothetical protein